MRDCAPVTCSTVADGCPPVRARGCGWWAPEACSVIGVLFSKLRVFARFDAVLIWLLSAPVQQKTPRAVRQARGARREVSAELSVRLC
jgi:hypothetical protein